MADESRLSDKLKKDGTRKIKAGKAPASKKNGEVINFFKYYFLAINFYVRYSVGNEPKNSRH
jgi:hypothetical protein